MRFWQKLYLCVLIVFILTLDLGIFALLQKSYTLNQQMETTRCSGQFQSVQNVLLTVLEQYGLETPALIASFADTYLEDGTFIELYAEDGSCIFSNAFELSISREEMTSDDTKTIYRKINGNLYLFIGGPVQTGNMRMVMIFNANYLQDYLKTLVRFFIFLTVALSTLLSIILIFLVKKLTKPIHTLNEAAKDIAHGALNRRVRIIRQDEIGEFADTFNQMADAVSKSLTDLQRSAQEKEVFINNLTHELKTPITAIKGYSTFLTNANCSEKERSLAISYILEHTNRLNFLSTKLMNLLYLKNESFSPVPVKVYQLFESVKRLEQHHLLSKNIQLEIQCDIDTVSGDETLLQMLFVNLVENSIKASSENSTILLKGYYHKALPVLSVTDYGIGIPPQDIQHLTEAFYMVDKSRSKKAGGIGLGLSICQLIANIHHAKLNISSVPGKYTQISCIFYK